MLKFLTLVSIAVSAPIVCEVATPDLESSFGSTRWAISEIQEHKASATRDKDRDYFHKQIRLSDSRNVSLFEFRIGVMDKIRFEGIAVDVVDCLRRSKFVVIILSPRSPIKSLQYYGLMHISGDDRAAVYLRIGILIQSALREGAFIKNICPSQVFMHLGDPHAAQVNVFNNIHPINENIRDKRKELAGRGLQLPASDFEFAQLYVTYYFKKFIDLFERKRTEEIENFVSSKESGTSESRLNVAEDMHPLPLFFVKIVKEMLDPSTNLEAVLRKMSQELYNHKKSVQPLLGSPKIPLRRTNSNSDTKNSSSS